MIMKKINFLFAIIVAALFVPFCHAQNTTAYPQVISFKDYVYEDHYISTISYTVGFVTYALSYYNGRNSGERNSNIELKADREYSDIGFAALSSISGKSDLPLSTSASRLLWMSFPQGVDIYPVKNVVSMHGAWTEGRVWDARSSSGYISSKVKRLT